MKKINIQKKNFKKYISLTLMLSGVNVFGMNNLSNLEKEENAYQKSLRTDIYYSLSKIKNSLNDKLYLTYKLIIAKQYGSSHTYTNSMHNINNILYVLGVISRTIEKFYDSKNLYRELLSHKIKVEIKHNIDETMQDTKYNTIFDKDLFQKILAKIDDISGYIQFEAGRTSIVEEKCKLINELKEEVLEVYENILKYLQCLSLYIDIRSLNCPNFRNVPDSKISAEELQILKLVETIKNLQKEIKDFEEEVIRKKKFFKEYCEEKIQNFKKEIKEEKIKEKEIKEEEINKKQEYYERT